MLHDTVPTGPPVRVPPHNLKGDDALFVTDEIDKQAVTGQLVRGNSAWGSPPFSTKDYAKHRKERKRLSTIHI